MKTLGLLILVGGLLSACESSSDSPSTTSDATQQQQAGQASCTQLCAAMKAAGCGDVTDVSEASCVDECAKTDALVADGAHTEACQAEWTAYKGCMTSTTLTCNGFTTNKGSCRAQYDHYINYCQGIATPETECIANDAFNAYCTSTPATPAGKVCRGNPEAGCVMGGNDNNADLYCCP